MWPRGGSRSGGSITPFYRTETERAAASRARGHMPSNSRHVILRCLCAPQGVNGTQGGGPSGTIVLAPLTTGSRAESRQSGATQGPQSISGGCATRVEGSLAQRGREAEILSGSPCPWLTKMCIRGRPVSKRDSGRAR